METRFNEVIRQEAAARGIVLVDAAKTLSGANQFGDFVHLSDRGAHTLACSIADAILKADERSRSRQPELISQR